MVRLEHRETRDFEWVACVFEDGFVCRVSMDKPDIIRVSAAPDEHSYWWIQLDLSGRVIAHVQPHPLYGAIRSDILARVTEHGPAIAAAIEPLALDLTQPVYIRFGELPAGGRSRNHATGQLEAGISCYRARRRVDGGYELVSSGLPYAAIAAAMGAYGNTVLLIAGEECGRGSDGEPVLRDVQVLGRLRYKDGRFVEVAN